LFVTTILAFAFSAIVEGALTRATIAESEGHRASFGECLFVGLRLFLPLVGVGIIIGLGFILGMMLLIIPAMFLLILWAVAIPAVVVEQNGIFRALGRSSQLTKGARWKVLH
jgi:hypothetical protein